MSTAAVTEPEPSTPQVPICEHIKDDGFRCGTPAIRGRHFCYYHSRCHAPSHLGTRQYRAPIPETIASLQLTIMQVTQALGSGTITEKTAGRLLYAVQLSTNLLKMKQPETAKRSAEERLRSADTPVRRESCVAATRSATSSAVPPGMPEVPTNHTVTPDSSIDNNQSPINTLDDQMTRSSDVPITDLSPAMQAALAPHPIEPIDDPEPQPEPITRKEFDNLVEQLMTREQIERIRPILGDGDANPAYNRATHRLSAHYDALQKLRQAGISEQDPRLQRFLGQKAAS